MLHQTFIDTNLTLVTGDHAYKRNQNLPLQEQMISPLPDIKTLELNPATDPWMILACDGIWNFMSSQEVVDYIEERIGDTPDDKLSSICEEVHRNHQKGFCWALQPFLSTLGRGS